MPPRKARPTIEERALRAEQRMGFGTVSGRVESASPVRRATQSTVTRAIAQPQTLMFSYNGTIATGDVEPPFAAPWAMVLLSCRLSCNSTTLPSGTVEVDVLLNTVSVFSTTPTIASGDWFGASQVATGDVSPDDEIQISVVQAGGALDLEVYLDFLRA